MDSQHQVPDSVGVAACPRARPIVLLDCDGVLADFLSAALRVVYEVTGDVFAPDQVVTFDFCAALGLNETDAAEVKRLIGACPGFAASIKPLPGAREGVARLRELAEVYVVTSPWNSNATWMSEREAWLKRWFGISHKHVIHTSAKHLVAGDVLVDDKASTIRAWSHGTAVLWGAPHNRAEAWEGRRTSSWTELLEIVGQISGPARIEAGLRELRDAADVVTAPFERAELGGEGGF